MNRHKLAAICLCVLVSSGCEPPANSPAPQGITTTAPPPPPLGQSAAGTPAEDAHAALVAAYRAAHAKKDVAAMLKLYCFDGVSEEMRETIRENVEAELRYPIASLSIDPVAPGSHGPRVEGGVRWRPSLEVVALLTVNFDTSRAAPGELATQQVRLTIGQKDGASYFTAPVRD